MPASLTAMPPGAGRRSTTATFFPNQAACVAAFSPAGPAPITTRSYRSTVGRYTTDRMTKWRRQSTWKLMLTTLPLVAGVIGVRVFLDKVVDYQGSVDFSDITAV